MSELTLDQFKDKVNGTRVECLICHTKLFSLSNHLQEAHNLSVGQYKNKYPRAEVTSKVILAMMHDRPRLKVQAATGVLESIWTSLSQWGQPELTKLGESMKHNSPELVPAKDNGYFFRKRETEVIGLAVARGMNLYISGPTECGKTAAVEQVHAYMNRPILRCNMTGDTSVKNFLGQMQLGPSGTFFSEGVLLKAMRLGCTLLVDEGDFMPPHIGAVLHPVLEGGRSVFVPDLNETLKAQLGFTVIMTANTGGKGDRAGIYTGTEVLNTAFLDRFQMKLELEYLPHNVEKKVLMDRFPEANEGFLDKLLSFADEVRKAFMQNNLCVTLGSRKLRDFMTIEKYMGTEEALRLVLLDWCTPEEKTLIEEFKIRVGL